MRIWNRTSVNAWEIGFQGNCTVTSDRPALVANSVIANCIYSFVRNLHSIRNETATPQSAPHSIDLTWGNLALIIPRGPITGRRFPLVALKQNDFNSEEGHIVEIEITI
jgi:hypothetical protein